MCARLSIAKGSNPLYGGIKWCSTALFSVLAACGGGGGGDSDPGTAPIVAAPAIFFSEGRIVDETSNGVNGAVITTKLNANVYTAITKADGTYRIEYPQNESFPAIFAATVSKEGSVPGIIQYNYNSQTKQFSVNPNATIRKSTLEDIILPKLTGITHLGDDNFGGAANSQLQVASIGKISGDTVTLTQAQLNTYRFVTINFYGRGIQTPPLLNCQDYAFVTNLDIATNVEQNTRTAILPPSDAGGNFTKLSVRLPTAGIKAGPVTIGLASGQCTTDFDDFELISVSASLSP